MACRQFKTTIKERVASGGASGALFFFSRSEMFMAKSCTIEEFATLTKNAKAYADYFESAKGTNSFISKVCRQNFMTMSQACIVRNVRVSAGVWGVRNET